MISSNLFVRAYAFLIVLIIFTACKKDVTTDERFTVSGRIETAFGLPIKDVKIYFSEDKFVTSDDQGEWEVMGMRMNDRLTPRDSNYTFNPAERVVTKSAMNEDFTITLPSTQHEAQISAWFVQQQLPNGLVESAENGNFVSLYDNALASMVFMVNGEFDRAAKVFDFFNARIESELKNGVGGFSQFRDANGTPSNHRWMGDNGWLLMALNNYKEFTGSTKYDQLASALTSWIMSLQDSDGGLFAGYDASGKLLEYKVTEGNIDAFNAVRGYSQFHKDLLRFFEEQLWDESDKNLIAWPDNPAYFYALDVHSWSYCCFDSYPSSALITADRFMNTQISTLHHVPITGYCFDEDQDVVWQEGTGQMALAFLLDGKVDQSKFYLQEMEKAFIESSVYENTGGFSYSVNQGTSYGGSQLWPGADLNICISSGAWYVFALKGFNPFGIERNKNMPQEDMFWLD